MQLSRGRSGAAAAQGQRSCTPPLRSRSQTPTRSCACGSGSSGQEGSSWQQGAGVGLLGLASLVVGVSPAEATYLPLPAHGEVREWPAATGQQQQRSNGVRGVLGSPSRNSQAFPHSLEWVEHDGTEEGELQNTVLRSLQQCQAREPANTRNRVLEDVPTEEEAAELAALVAELQQVVESERFSLLSLRQQEEVLLRLAHQLQEAAHSEINSLQAREERLLAVIGSSAARLKTMQQDEGQGRQQHLLIMQDPQQIVQSVLSGSFVMVAGGACASAANAYLSSTSNTGTSTSGSKAGGSSGAGSSGRGASGRGLPVIAAAAALWAAAPATAGRKEGSNSRRSRHRTSNGDGSGSSSDADSPSPQPAALAGLQQQLQALALDDVPAAGLRSNNPGAAAAAAEASIAEKLDLMHQLHSQAAEAAAAAQALCSLQQQDAAAALNSAALAADLMQADIKVAEATASEAAAAQLLVAAERAARQAAEEAAGQLRQQVAALQGRLVLQEKGWGPRRAGAAPANEGPALTAVPAQAGRGRERHGGGEPAVLQEQLAQTHARLATATDRRAAAEVELKELTTALIQEQRQSASIAARLEATEDSLNECSLGLHALQQQLHHERTTAQQQLQQLQVAQRQEVQTRQDAEQSLADVRAQLAAALQELHQERDGSKQLHQQLAQLHGEFDSARAALDAEAAKAAALAEERNRLEAAFAQVSSEGQAAQAAAEAAQAEAAEASVKAQRAAAEAMTAQQLLAAEREDKSAVEHKLRSVMEVVDKQQGQLRQQEAVLQAKQQQLGQAQQDVVSTRGALRDEIQRGSSLQSMASSLQVRISNMAAVRDRSNQALTGQLDRLRSQLECSKKSQQDSQAQVQALRHGTVAVKQQLTAEQAASRNFRETAHELTQRLANMRVVGAQHAQQVASAAARMKADEAAAQAAAAAAAGKLAASEQQSQQQISKLSRRLADEAGKGQRLEATAGQLQQRLSNLRATVAAHAGSTQGARAAGARARQVDAAMVTKLRERSRQLAQVKQQHAQQLQEVVQQLAASESTAAAAKEAERAARAQVLALQQQVEQQQAAAAAQAEALAAAKTQLARLKERAAETREQLEQERERAQSHEATVQQLQRRIAALQDEAARGREASHARIAGLVSQLEGAMARMADAAGTKAKAESAHQTALLSSAMPGALESRRICIRGPSEQLNRFDASAA